MAVLVGGAALVFAVLTRDAADGDSADDAHLSRLAETYEVLFWVAIGLLVMTGIGNLAAFGPSLPSGASPWGQKLLAKLALVGLLMLASVSRSMLVATVAASGSAVPVREARAVLRVAYALTLGLGVAVLALAMWLAHG